jgi:hypothetical protein
MNVSKASKIWLDYHQINSKKKHISKLFGDNGQILRGVCRSST